jgi:hypothetical protein
MCANLNLLIKVNAHSLKWSITKSSIKKCCMVRCKHKRRKRERKKTWKKLERKRRKKFKKMMNQSVDRRVKCVYFDCSKSMAMTCIFCNKISENNFFNLFKKCNYWLWYAVHVIEFQLATQPVTMSTPWHLNVTENWMPEDKRVTVKDSVPTP